MRDQVATHIITDPSQISAFGENWHKRVVEGELFKGFCLDFRAEEANFLNNHKITKVKSPVLCYNFHKEELTFKATVVCLDALNRKII